MPRHLTSDAHEWINEIPTVPIYYLANPQPRERAWNNRRGKKTLVRRMHDVLFVVYNDDNSLLKESNAIKNLTLFFVSLFLLLPSFS